MMRQIYPKKRKPKQRKSKPLPRKVHINGEEWRWEFVKSKVKILSPSNEYWAVGIDKVSGMGWDVLDRAMDKLYFHLTPATVKKYIEDNILQNEHSISTR